MKIKTEPNIQNSKTLNSNKNSNDAISNEEFIGLINTLSDSIKEFYKVSKNVNKTKNMLINLAEGEINLIETILDKLSKKEINYEEINSFSNIIEKLRDIFNKLQLNIISEEKNLIFFFEDAKVLFKKMKEKRQEIIMKIKKRATSAIRKKYESPFASSHNNFDVNICKKIKIDISDKFNRSKTNYNIKNYKTNDRNSQQRIIIDVKKRKSKTLNKGRESIIDDDYQEKSENNLNSTYYINKEKSENKLIDSKSQNIENENLKILNKKISQDSKKVKTKTLQTNKNMLENSIKNKINNISIIHNKDKIISDLRNDISEKSKKNSELIDSLNNYKNEIKKLKEENNKLKNYFQTNKNVNNNNKNMDKNFKIKINNLVKENALLKKHLEEIKLDNNNTNGSDYNSKLSINNDLNFVKI